MHESHDGPQDQTVGRVKPHQTTRGDGANEAQQLHQGNKLVPGNGTERGHLTFDTKIILNYTEVNQT